MSEQPQEQPNLAVRIARALAFAQDADHDMSWTVDQMVRALTGCPPVTKTDSDVGVHGEPYSYGAMGESAGYRQFVAEFDAKWGTSAWQESHDGV